MYVGLPLQSVLNRKNIQTEDKFRKISKIRYYCNRESYSDYLNSEISDSTTPAVIALDDSTVKKQL